MERPELGALEELELALELLDDDELDELDGVGVVLEDFEPDP